MGIRISDNKSMIVIDEKTLKQVLESMDDAIDSLDKAYYEIWDEEFLITKNKIHFAKHVLEENAKER